VLLVHKQVGDHVTRAGGAHDLAGPIEWQAPGQSPAEGAKVDCGTTAVGPSDGMIGHIPAVYEATIWPESLKLKAPLWEPPNEPRSIATLLLLAKMLRGWLRARG